MEKKHAPRVQRLIKGLKQLSKGNHEYIYTTGARSMNCRIDEHWHKRLSTISETTTQEISAHFETYTILQQQQLGKKSQQIVFSGDGQLVLKLATILDLRKFEKIVDEYIQYIRSNPHSVITPILRVFSVKTLEYDVSDCFILMESARPLVEHTAYDVKGLLDGRSISDDDGVPSSGFGKDFQLVNSPNVKLLQANQTLITSVWESLKIDLQFFAHLNIMDYSLIICFFKVPPIKQIKNQVRLQDGSFCSFGIVDYLQEYNTIKKMEGVFKGLFKSVSQISTVDCEAYAKRMLEFVDKHMRHHEA